MSANIPCPKFFLFIRHAIAVDATEFDGVDADRPLTKRGAKKERAAFHGLTAFRSPTRILTSPLRRARETAELLRQEVKAGGAKPPKIEETRALAPGTTVERWLSALAHLEPPLNSEDIVAVIGHEPSLGKLCAHHLGVEGALPIKRGGAAVLAPTRLDKADLIAFAPAKVWAGESASSR